MNTLKNKESVSFPIQTEYELRLALDLLDKFDEPYATDLTCTITRSSPKLNFLHYCPIMGHWWMYKQVGTVLPVSELNDFLSNLNSNTNGIHES